MEGKYTIAIVVEGNEEECLFDIAKACNGIDSCFDVELVVSNGYGEIGPYFQDSYSNPSVDCVVAVYDVDDRSKKEDSPFAIVRNELLSVLGDETAVDMVSFCTNPNILQILLLGCDEFERIKIASSSKKVNSEIVSKYWPKISSKEKDGKKIKNGYEATKWQLEIIKNSYIYEEDVSYNYETLLENAAKLNSNYKNNLPGSNIYDLLKSLKNGDIQFFNKIKKKTKGD